MPDMTDATPTIEEMPEMRPSAEERLARKYESGRHAYPSYAKLARERAGDFTLCSIEAIAEAYRDGYTAALSSLSPLIEAARRDALEEAALKADAVADVIMTRADDYHEREEYDLYEELEGQAGVATQIRDDIRALSTFPAPAKE